MCFLWPLQEAPLRSDSPGDSCGSCFQAFVRISRRIEGLSEGCWSGYRTQHWGKIGVVMTKNICDASKSNRTQSKIPKSFKYHFSHFTLFMSFYVSEFGTPSPWFFPYFAPFLMAMEERCHGRPQLGSKPPGPRPGPGPVGPASVPWRMWPVPGSTTPSAASTPTRRWWITWKHRVLEATNLRRCQKMPNTSVQLSIYIYIYNPL